MATPRSESLPLKATLQAVRRALAAQRLTDGHWEGRLSSSALATAVALFALHRLDRAHPLSARGVQWLVTHVNSDGGWGDTPSSASNLSATLLGWAVLGAVAPRHSRAPDVRRRAAEWIRDRAGGVDPESLSRAIVASYGDDRTFSAPILALAALAGCLGDSPEAWRQVPPLPFELGWAPRWLLRRLRLSVVSYALPALLAVGALRHRQAPTPNRPVAWLRDRLVGLVGSRLERLQPVHGGFLEAIPLTAFVLLCLHALGAGDGTVARRAARFLESAVRADGSWPVDTHLATWVTTLAVTALRGEIRWRLDGVNRPPRRPDEGPIPPCLPPEPTLSWLLDQQTRQTHPFTGAAPGGWSWTPLPGGVPDADDTSGALLALKVLAPTGARSTRAALAGVDWLLGLQNSDGGFPTFCRGWGRLPFDRSCPDITAHALAALDAWYDAAEPRRRLDLDTAMERGMEYLTSSQEPDGAWIPLWFGNEEAPDQANPTYGTARVLAALGNLTPGRLPGRDALMEKGAAWLRAAQNADGGWGGAAGVRPSIEETALAIQGLCAADAGDREPIRRGVAWLCHHTRGGTCFESRPIGLYFSRLWYAEDLYPVIFTAGALARAAETLGDEA